MSRLGKLLTPFALILVLGVPFLFRGTTSPIAFGEDVVVVITPHTESIRHEFGRAFSDWYKARTGRGVRVDYRVIGGTSEISKFLDSAYTNAFRNHWQGELGRDWTLEVQEAFNNARIELDSTPEDDSLAEAARRSFLESEVSSGIDVFFGGGTYDFSLQAGKGALVDAGLLELYPEWFQETAEAGVVPAGIPRELAGETFYDKEGRWFGAVLSSYGIIYNRDSLKRLGISEEPRHWSDLANERLLGQIAVCDPTKSGSMTQAFEMIIQQQMQLRVSQFPQVSLEENLSIGWKNGMQLIQKIVANARYLTDSSQKPNIDVAMGDCAAGMSIDFYGRFQQENILQRSGDARFGFHSPLGGSTVSADPVGLLRGARNLEAARLFIEFVLSEDGQKLWNFKVETPGGPETFSLRRPPIRPDLYDAKWISYRADATVNPYLATGSFTYHRDWTGRLFSELRTIIRVCFIDVHKELKEAWGAIAQARLDGRDEAADRAEAVLQDLERISYAEAKSTIDAALKAPRIEEVRLARSLSDHFRTQYAKARDLARAP